LTIFFSLLVAGATHCLGQLEVKLAMWMFAGFFSILVTTNAAAQSCPANQIASDAQIIQSVIPVSSTMHVSSSFDTNLTFFSEVLGYSDEEIQQDSKCTPVLLQKVWLGILSQSAQ